MKSLRSFGGQNVLRLDPFSRRDERNAPPEDVIDSDRVRDVSAFMGPDRVFDLKGAGLDPDTSWTLIRYGYTIREITPRYPTVGGNGLEVDKMDPGAVDAYFDRFLSGIFETAGGHVGKPLSHIHIDSNETGFQNWTARMPEEFAQRRGYDLLPWLPAMTGRIVGSVDREVNSQSVCWHVADGKIEKDGYFASDGSKARSKRITSYASEANSNSPA